LDTKHDEQLVQAACQGEAKAIEALLLKHHTDVSRFARTLCATPEDAEDALQETLWIVSQKIGALHYLVCLIDSKQSKQRLINMYDQSKKLFSD
jgi:hypothetical protein